MYQIGGETVAIRVYDDELEDIVRIKEVQVCEHTEVSEQPFRPIGEDRDFLAMYILERGN